MSLRDTPAARLAYVGLLAASTACIAILAIYLVTALLAIPFDFIVPPTIAAASAVVFAIAATALSEKSTAPEGVS